jgi:hypothetical protein
VQNGARELVSQVVAHVVNCDDQHVLPAVLNSLDGQIVIGDSIVGCLGLGLRSVEPKRDGELLARPKHVDARRGACLARGITKLFDLLVAQASRDDPAERQDHVAVDERWRCARLDPESHRRPLGPIPKASRRSCLEIKLIDARLFFERSPRTMGIDFRHVSPNGRRQDDARPLGDIELGKITLPGFVRVRTNGGAERPIEGSHSAPEHLGQRAGRPCDRGAFESGRTGRYNRVFILPIAAPCFVENLPQLTDPRSKRRSQRNCRLAVG